MKLFVFQRFKQREQKKEKNLILIAMINVCEIILDLYFRFVYMKRKMKGNEVECERRKQKNTHTFYEKLMTI